MRLAKFSPARQCTASVSAATKKLKSKNSGINLIPLNSNDIMTWVVFKQIKQW